MRFEMSSQDRAFLTLASKVVGGHATAKEKIDFERLLIDQPSFRQEFRRFEEELRYDRQQEFWLSAVRVILKVASAEEVKMIRSLKETDPKQWEKYQDALEFLEVLAARAESIKTRKVQPMPAPVREELLAGLKATRIRRGRH
ncbi:MAG: hypothetical protein NT031_05095 [Planctomycetota bacterium]|nr:hypothetical protein [Planctomycetota bacterium]